MENVSSFGMGSTKEQSVDWLLDQSLPMVGAQ